MQLVIEIELIPKGDIECSTHLHTLFGLLSPPQLVEFYSNLKTVQI